MPDGVADSQTNVSEDIELLTAEEVDPIPEKSLIKAQQEVQDTTLVEDEETDLEEIPSEVEEDKAPAHIYSRPSITDLNKAYPEFFKKFPEMKNVIQREKEYTLLYPTLQEAREAKESSDAMDVLRQDVRSGDCTKFIQALKDEGDSTLNNFCEKILRAVATVSMDAHWKAALPLLQNTVRAFYNEGVKFGDNETGNNYRNAAGHLSKFLFNDWEVAEGKKSVVREEIKNPEQEAFKKEKDDFELGKYNEFRVGISNEAASKLKQMILSKDKNDRLKIDPNGTMSEWMRNTLADKIFSEVSRQMELDKDHMAYMESLWRSVRQGKRTEDNKARIISAFLARAQSLVPAVRSNMVSEALGSRAKAVKDDNERLVPRRDSPPEKRNNGSGKSIDWSKTSDLDILNDNVTYKK